MVTKEILKILLNYCSDLNFAIALGIHIGALTCADLPCISNCTLHFTIVHFTHYTRYKRDMHHNTCVSFWESTIILYDFFICFNMFLTMMSLTLTLYL